jgi:hypothetical protein
MATVNNLIVPLISSMHSNIHMSLADALDGAVVTQDDEDIPGEARKLLEPVSVGAHGM